MKTELEKSHSKYSNFKLTLLSIFTILFFTAFVFIIISYKKIEKEYYYPILIITGFLTLLCLVLFNKFTR